MANIPDKPCTLASRLRSIIRPEPLPGTEHLNLRAWFLVYVLWLVLLTAVTRGALAEIDVLEKKQQGIALLSMGVFYLSLCCLFFPAPTAWIVMLLASNQVALIDSVPVRIAVVACVCGFATGVANLNEYHIITFFLRYRRVAKLRNTRAYQLAAKWFATSPFAVIVAVGFLPLPVDAIRWLAIASCYPRARYFLAYFVGRSLRYAVWGLSVVWLDWVWWEILIFQAVVLLLAGLKVVHSWRKNRPRPRPVPSRLRAVPETV